MKALVLTAISLRGIAAWSAMSGVCGCVMALGRRNFPWLRTHLEQRTGPDGTEKQEYNLLSPDEMKSLSTRAASKVERSAYWLERSSSIMNNPLDSVIKNQAPQICSRYLLLLATICPAIVATSAPPTEYGIWRTPAPVAECPRTWK